MKKALCALALFLSLALPVVRPQTVLAAEPIVLMGILGAAGAVGLYGEQYIINHAREERRINRLHARVPVTGYLKPPPVGHASTPAWSYPTGYANNNYDPRHAHNPVQTVPTVVYSSVQATRAGQPVYSMHPRDRALLQEALRQSDEAREEARAARRDAGLGLSAFFPDSLTR